MSLIKSIKNQLGLSVTPANNFVLDASADNGTMKLARNSGQDIMTVDAAGKVGFPQLPFSFGTGGASKGHITLPNGLLVNWGTVTINTPAVDTWASTTDTLSKPFTTAMFGASVSSRNAPLLSNQAQVFSIIENGLTAVEVSGLSQISAVSGMAAYYICWGV